MSGRRIFALLLLGLAGGLLVAGCSRDNKKTVKLIGSTSVQPFAQELATQFEKAHPDYRVQVEGGGSTMGVQMAVSGVADIGTCSRDLTPEEAAQLKATTIARDGVAIIVNADNPVEGLTTEQIRDIFMGKITNWKEVGGKDHAIMVVVREEGSGTREAFSELVMNKEPVAHAALSQASNGAVKAMVKGDAAGIGYMSLGQVGQDVKALKVDGEAANDANILNGKYKVARPFLFVTKGTPRPDSQAFIDFVLSDAGQKMLVDEGLIRAK